jgi:hypothetical protein
VREITWSLYSSPLNRGVRYIINCERLCSYPDVRAFIASQRCSKSYVSAEEFLEHYDRVVIGGVFGLLGGITSLGADLGHALARRLDLKTGKEREATIQLPCGEVLVAILAVRKSQVYR